MILPLIVEKIYTSTKIKVSTVNTIVQLVPISRGDRQRSDQLIEKKSKNKHLKKLFKIDSPHDSQLILMDGLHPSTKKAVVGITHYQRFNQSITYFMATSTIPES